MRTGRWISAGFFAAALPLLVACPTPPGGVVYVSTGPPPFRTEYVGVAPGPDHIWVRGFHQWDGVSYVWVPGHFERRPRAGAKWVDGRWRHNRRGWFWVAGHWR